MGAETTLYTPDSPLESHKKVSELSSPFVPLSASARGSSVAQTHEGSSAVPESASGYSMELTSEVSFPGVPSSTPGPPVTWTNEFLAKNRRS